ncbi:hypothetical protein K2173_003385 [Erythroxylum novogranatense]|uniref:Uncharacterized protein n=1 Tax=Erythroxylum novogranatense TaxID=1862640 RepID=A0AAV8S8V8_9ROSI|nr:hypothetical protein K2173_003385 [Erythroxylum novogranatense]
MVVMFLRRAYVGLPLSRRLLSTNSVNNHHDLSATIAELNKEMESVFGQPPTGLAGSINNDHALPESDFKSHSIASSLRNETMAQEEEDHRLSKRVSHNVHGLTHVGSTGEAQMVDVSPKEASKRTAIAGSEVILGGRLNPENYSVEIQGEASSTEKTGVEMEAMMCDRS